MIEIRSFVRLPNGGAILAEEWIRDAAGGDEVDLVSIEGYIELVVQGEQVLGANHWDYLYLLWADLAAAVENLRSTGDGALQFADQPLELGMQRVSEGVELRLNDSSYGSPVIVNEAQFVQACRSRGAAFLDGLGLVAPSRMPVLREILGQLRRDPAENLLASVDWRQRLSSKQVAAVEMAIRATGVQGSGDRVEKVVDLLAGVAGGFDSWVALAIEELSSAR
jgi:hypothetical protein